MSSSPLSLSRFSAKNSYNGYIKSSKLGLLLSLFSICRCLLSASCQISVFVLIALSSSIAEDQIRGGLVAAGQQVALLLHSAGMGTASGGKQGGFISKEASMLPRWDVHCNGTGDGQQMCHNMWRRRSAVPV